MEKTQIKEIVDDVKNRPNKDIVLAMNTLNTEFNQIKTFMLKLSTALDEIEKLYGILLSEYKSRTNNGK